MWIHKWKYTSVQSQTDIIKENKYKVISIFDIKQGELMITITKIPPITALSLKMKMTVHKTNIRDAEQITNLVIPKFKQELFAQTSTDFKQPETEQVFK